MAEFPVLFKNLTSDELHAALAPQGVSLRLARRLQAVVLRTGVLPAEMPEVSTRLLAALRASVEVPALALESRNESPRDGFAKYVFRGQLGDRFEAVGIPLLHRADDEKVVACVSSQVGCAMGCAFCATGRMGFRRNLAAWEIVDQVIQIQAASPHPVRGVVFMGMGEPLLNYDAVITASRILSEPCGLAISAKAITLSTVGIPPAIRRFTAERHPFRLVVSLTSADPQRRAELMPVERKHPTTELMTALREYHAATGQRVTLAWTLLDGINTRPEDAAQLAELTRGLPVKIDLIDVNDPTGRFRPPAPATLAVFRDALRQHLAAPVARRYSGGSDIHAACGMLGDCRI
jgi:23S rRNA (adenine2503-C2)-methyltransferase